MVIVKPSYYMQNSTPDESNECADELYCYKVQHIYFINWVFIYYDLTDLYIIFKFDINLSIFKIETYYL